MKRLYHNVWYRIEMVKWHLAQQRRDHVASLEHRRKANHHQEQWELLTWQTSL